MSDTAYDPAARGDDRFDAIEHLLARYPELTDEEVARLKRWFRKEATAFEVASMAGKDRIAPGYRSFRADHVDRITPTDTIRILSVCVLAIVAIAVLIMLGG